MTTYSKIKKELEEKLRELTERVDEIDENLSAAANEDWDENAIESEGDEVLEGVGRLALAEISEIKYALSRIEAGTYGTCSECGGEIGQARLEALPSASRCISCS